MLNIQNYVRAESLDQAYELVQNKRNRILGGMLWLRMEDIAVGKAIDLSGLGLDTIGETDEAFSIGACVTLRQLEKHAGLNVMTNYAVRDAVQDIVGVQFRNLATVGGSLWGRFGFSDVLTVFQALGAQVELHHAGVMPLAQFAEMTGVRDVLVRVIVPKCAGRFAYQAVRAQRTDFPTLTCAAAVTADRVCVAIGARPGRAIEVKDEQGLLKDGVTPETVRAFAQWAATIVPTGTNARGSAEYRTRLVRVLTERTLLAAGGVDDAD